MDRNFFEELRASINGGVTPLEHTRLSTKSVKLALGTFLLQNIIIALIWSIKDGNSGAWALPIVAFLQVGWFWNKVTASWKDEQGSLARFPVDTIPEGQVTLNVSTESIVTGKTQQVHVPLNTVDHPLMFSSESD